MDMETTAKCIELMDFSNCWTDWRDALKQSITSSRTYYQDETVQVLMSRLNEFLSKRLCATSVDEEVIDAMWEVSTPEERKTLATVFLKVADKLSADRLNKPA